MSVDLKGNEVRVEQTGREVHLIFVTKAASEADGLREEIIEQLKSGGGFHLTLRRLGIEDIS
jgi:hypothetical protein